MFLNQLDPFLYSKVFNHNKFNERILICNYRGGICRVFLFVCLVFFFLLHKTFHYCIILLLLCNWNKNPLIFKDSHNCQTGHNLRTDRWIKDWNILSGRGYIILRSMGKGAAWANRSISKVLEIFFWGLILKFCLQ